jgi:hypothetical protein
VLAGTAPLSYSIYADECKPERRVSPWLIMGVLVLADANIPAALSVLRRPRRLHGYEREVHFSTLTNSSESQFGAKTAVAKDWVHSVCADRTKIWNLHIRAIRPSLLNTRLFGQDAEDSIYTRFFRATLKYALLASVGGGTISRVFHDDTSLNQHRYFPWNAIRNLRSEDVQFATNEIDFISSNHGEPGHPFPQAAEFIQLVDVWMGAFRELLLACSRKAGKIEVASASAPFFEILNEPDHRCYSGGQTVCHYDHRNRCSVGFFPRNSLLQQDGAGVAMRIGGIYVGEPFALLKEPRQQALF